MAEPVDTIYFITNGQFSKGRVVGGVFTTLELAQAAAVSALTKYNDKHYYYIYKIPINQVTTIIDYNKRDNEYLVQTIYGEPDPVTYTVVYNDGNYGSKYLDTHSTLEQAKQQAWDYLNMMKYTKYRGHNCTIQTQKATIWWSYKENYNDKK